MHAKFGEFLSMFRGSNLGFNGVIGKKERKKEGKKERKKERKKEASKQASKQTNKQINKQTNKQINTQKTIGSLPLGEDYCFTVVLCLLGSVPN